MLSPNLSQGLAPGVYYGAVPEPPNPYEPIPAYLSAAGGAGTREGDESDKSSVASGGHRETDPPGDAGDVVGHADAESLPGSHARMVAGVRVPAGTATGTDDDIVLSEPADGAGHSGRKWTARVRGALGRIVPLHEVESYSQEFSGMLGDLGLYIPLVIALALSGQVGLGSTLIFSGLANILTGLTFSIPMCVQPMKSIAAVALANNLTNPQIMASGICTGGVVLALGATNLIGAVNAAVPNTVVRGLQLGLGFTLFRKAVEMLPDRGRPTWAADAWLHWDGFLGAALALLFALVFVRSRRVPTALLLFAAGLAIASGRFAATGAQLPALGVPAMQVVRISANDWLVGLLQGAVPQVPTTLLNSCIAVCRLAEDLYPDRKTGVSVRAVASSVGALNLVFCWFGALPVCHGAGGLAGQHRFGARTNLSVLVLGTVKLALGAAAAAPLLAVLGHFPAGVLAALLSVSALELAASARSALTGDPEGVRLCLLTAGCTVFFGTAIGFAAGLAAAYALALAAAVVGSDEEVAEARARIRARLTEARARLARTGGARTAVPRENVAV